MRLGGENKGQAFTLIEVVVSIGLFALVLAVVFALFHFGARGFKKAQERSYAHSQILSTKAALSADLQRGHFLGVHSEEFSVSVPKLDGSGTVQARRDKLATVALSTWLTSAPGAQSESQAYGFGGIPNWDSYVLYVAGQAPERATELHRYVFFEGTGATLAEDAANLRFPEPLFTALVGDPALDATAPGLVKRTLLADSLSQFAVELDYQAQLVTVRLRVLEDPTKGEIAEQGEQNRGSLSAVFSFRPYNTVPKL